MKILHLDSGRGMRGGQFQALRLHESLVRRGHDSMLLARKDGPLFAAARQRNLPLEALRPLRLPLRSRDFDLMHAHDAHSHTLGALFSHVPLIVSRRVSFPIRTSPVSRWKYRSPARYLAVSRFVAGILGNAGIPADRIDVVYDGVEIPTVPATGDSLVTPFTNDPGKCMTLAIEAAAIAGVPLVCSKDLNRDLNSARCLIYLSHSEGLGSAILLAMARGVTVIATRTGGIPELIDDGVTGVLVRNEPNEVAEAIRKLDRRLGDAGRELVRHRFTVEHMVASTIKAYLKALNV